jgi:heat-inducible transcriptional repressor
VMLDLAFDISRAALEITTQVLNERLSGLSLGEIKRTINERLSSVSAGHPELIGYFQTSAKTLFDFDAWENYYFRGTGNILRNPEFSNSETVDGLLEMLESKISVIQILGISGDQPAPRVSIGSENDRNRLEPFSLVASGYHVGNVHGVLGIIGPTRMDYARMVSIVNYMSSTISRLASN